MPATLNLNHCTALSGDPPEAGTLADVLESGDPYLLFDIPTYERALRNDICVFCGHSGLIIIDHIQPKRWGGENGWDNYAAICQGCNNRKNAKNLIAFMGWLRNPSPLWCRIHPTLSLQPPTPLSDQELKWRREELRSDLEAVEGELRNRTKVAGGR